MRVPWCYILQMNLRRTCCVFRIAATLVLGMAGAGVSVNAQAVRLQVVAVADNAGLKHPQRLAETGDTAESAFNRTETFRVTVHNLQFAPADCLVEWQFLATDVTTRKNYVYDHGTNQVVVKGGASTTFAVQSKPLAENEIQRYDYDWDDNGNWVMYPVGNREKSGAKPAGYIFLLKTHGKLIAVEASDSDLKEPYQKEVTANLLHPAP